MAMPAQGTGAFYPMSVGDTGGTNAFAAPSGGMSAMGGFSLGSQLLGGALNAYGEYQGARALERAAQKQQAEQAAIQAQQNALVEAELRRRAGSPVGLQQTAGTTARMGQTLAAVNPAGAAAGRALGVNAAGINAARTNLLPRARVAAGAGAEDARHTRDQFAMQQMGLGMGNLRRQGDELAMLYPTQDELAGMTGGTARTAGSLMSFGGKALGSYAMNQKA